MTLMVQHDTNMDMDMDMDMDMVQHDPLYTATCSPPLGAWPRGAKR